ncbi:MAG: sulfatase-like hydrolase/transferase [Bacteroidales bacterium]|nr:sulfatase-like hydrolase/transferase [Bacteroidales bacterium]
MKLPRINNFYRFLIYPIILVFLISISRLLLWAFNPDLFPELSTNLFLRIWSFGLKFDFSAFAYLHIPALILLFIPFKLRRHKWYRILVVTMLSIINFIIIIPNLIDLIYFRFTLKRLGADVFTMLFSISDEMNQLSSQFLHDFWYIALLLIPFIFIIVISIRFSFRPFFNSTSRIRWWKQILVFIFSAALIFAISRGSLRIRPLGLIHASEIAGADFAPLVSNSAFSIIKTFGKDKLKEKDYFSEQELHEIFPYGRNYYKKDEPQKKPNIVIIIVESLSAEHMGCLNNGLPSYTPFLDSLSNHSLLFTQMYANGRISLDGIPAIINGLPPLLNGSISTSMYAGNNLPGIAKMLKPFGYYNSFFHGGSNGTMNFDALSLASGYEKYYGRNEYPGPNSDFDGNWGIFDEPWLQFMAEELNTMPEPFHATVFTLSSHHPYTIPEQHIDRFPKGNGKLHECIGYADYSLQKFFNRAQEMPWFQNTLFIITADHTGEIMNDCFVNAPNNYAIPMIWYAANDSTLDGQNDILCQQTDILPSIADYLNINATTYGFGHSVFDQELSRFAVLYINKIYRLLMHGKMLDFDEKEILNYRQIFDCRMERSEVKSDQEEELRFLKALIQQFNNRMIHNKLCSP